MLAHVGKNPTSSPSTLPFISPAADHPRPALSLLPPPPLSLRLSLISQSLLAGTPQANPQGPFLLALNAQVSLPTLATPIASPTAPTAPTPTLSGHSTHVLSLPVRDAQPAIHPPPSRVFPRATSFAHGLISPHCDRGLSIAAQSGIDDSKPHGGIGSGWRSWSSSMISESA